jgi:hypothetical protein
VLSLYPDAECSYAESPYSKEDAEINKTLIVPKFSPIIAADKSQRKIQNIVKTIYYCGLHYKHITIVNDDHHE